MNEWINVDDRVPEISEETLVLTDNCAVIAILATYYPEEKVWCNFKNQKIIVTSWMSIPKRPNKDSNK